VNAVFVFSSHAAELVGSEDRSTMMRCLAVKKFLPETSGIACQLVNSEVKRMLLDVGITQVRRRNTLRGRAPPRGLGPPPAR